MLSKGHQLRIRITDDVLAEICYKYPVDKETKEEFEYTIPIEDGKRLLDLAEIKLAKWRRSFDWEGNKVDIDLYPDGLEVIEIEFKDELLEVPTFCGQEVTGVKGYSNISIARRLTALAN